jgi:hypothetical protein
MVPNHLEATRHVIEGFAHVLGDAPQNAAAAGAGRAGAMPHLFVRQMRSPRCAAPVKAARRLIPAPHWIVPTLSRPAALQYPRHGHLFSATGSPESCAVRAYCSQSCASETTLG